MAFGADVLILNMVVAQATRLLVSSDDIEVHA
jgi:hypothetical protein